VLVPARHLAFVTLLVGEFLTPLNPHVQISELETCEFSQLLIRDAQRKRGLSAGPSGALSFQALYLAAEFSLCDS